jgi:hypothetical protein
MGTHTHSTIPPGSYSVERECVSPPLAQALATLTVLAFNPGAEAVTRTSPG